MKNVENHLFPTSVDLSSIYMQMSDNGAYFMFYNFEILPIS